MKMVVKALISILMLMTWTVQAVASPARLKSISEHAKNPVRVATDSQGNIYIAETAKNIVTIFTRDGRYLKSLPADGPIGLAVDGQGRIYVGSGGKKSIDVYNPDLSFSHSLGSGAGEIELPNAIDIGADGKVYAVDNNKHMIVVYAPSGGRAFTFGSFGSNNGRLVKPTGVAVNDAAGEIYVTDQPIIQTSSGPANGARIQVFDLNGGFKRSFGQYGTGPGQMTRIMDIAVDKAGRLYIPDSYQGVVHIADPVTGTIIGSLSDSSSPMSVPTGVAITKNQAALIAVYNGAKVEVYALDGYASMDVSPRSLGFEARQFGPNPSAKTVSITNAGTGAMAWTASKDQDWIVLEQTSGTVPGGSASGLSVSANVAGLAPGFYSGKVSVSAEFGWTEIVSIGLTVLPPPVLTLSSGWLTFDAKKGGNPPSQTVSIGIENAAYLDWSAVSDSSWIGIAPASGSRAGAVTVSINSANLAVGSYTGFITFRAPGAIGDGSKIIVSLNVAASAKITVSTNRADARFTLSGPASYTGSGMSWSVDGAPAGEYTVAYDSIEGYKRPPAETKILPEGGEVMFTGNYISWKDIAAQKDILTAAGPGPKNPAHVKVFKNDGSPAGFDMIALDTLYGASVASGDVDGDGAAEIIVGAGPGPDNPALVRLYKSDGSVLIEFKPFASTHGVNVAAADFNGDGKAELVVAPASGPENTALVKVYTFDNDTREMVLTGIELEAHDCFYGANVSIADTNGDGRPEIVTSPGPGPECAAEVKIWSIDASLGAGAWTAAEAYNKLVFSGNYGLTIAAGDMDGDGIDELVIGPGPNPKAAAEVKIVRADGTELKRFTAFKEYRYGVNVAAADLDGDGRAEVIAGAGPDPGNAAVKAWRMNLRGKKNKKQLQDVLRRYGLSSVEPEKTMKVYSADGKLKYAVNPYAEAAYGVRVSIGDLGL